MNVSMISIDMAEVAADKEFIADLRIALCHLFERKCERIGKTGDMDKDVKLAEDLLVIRNLNVDLEDM